jgi:hypothetical protein
VFRPDSLLNDPLRAPAHSRACSQRQDPRRSRPLNPRRIRLFSLQAVRAVHPPAGRAANLLIAPPRLPVRSLVCGLPVSRRSGPRVSRHNLRLCSPRRVRRRSRLPCLRGNLVVVPVRDRRLSHRRTRPCSQLLHQPASQLRGLQCSQSAVRRVSPQRGRRANHHHNPVPGPQVNRPVRLLDSQAPPHPHSPLRYLRCNPPGDRRVSPLRGRRANRPRSPAADPRASRPANLLYSRAPPRPRCPLRGLRCSPPGDHRVSPLRGHHANRPRNPVIGPQVSRPVYQQISQSPLHQHNQLSGLLYNQPAYRRVSPLRGRRANRRCSPVADRRASRPAGPLDSQVLHRPCSPQGDLRCSQPTGRRANP